MGCTNCSSSGPLGSFNINAFFSNDCFQCSDNSCGGNIQNAKCIIYTGANLSCSGILTNDSLETALQKIDEQICSAIGDYSNYQFNCLPTWWGSSITQESQFVDAITSYACSISTTLSTFTDTTFVSYQETVDSRFDAIEVPGITCAAASVTNTDTLQQVLNKYCTKITSIANTIDVSSYSTVWNQCLTVVTPPTDLEDAFSLLVDQICQVKSLVGTLPTFDNTGSCLPSPGATDSLADTIGKIKTRLCQSPTLDNSLLTSSCVSIPGTATDLQTLLQSMLTSLDTLLQALPTFDNGDFNVTQTGEDPCSGVTVALQTPINQDRFVASNNLDSSPGTLADKLDAGTGIDLDYITTPGKVIISTDGVEDHKVLANSLDDTPGYLDQKTEGAVDQGITIDTVYDAGTKKLKIFPSVDLQTLAQAIYAFTKSDPATLALFCEVQAECPCLCGTDDCIEYEVTDTSGSPNDIAYNDCISNALVTIALGADATIKICAKQNSVTSASSATITAVGTCAGGTTTTTSTTTVPL